ncbi:MbeD/MobD family mobilization/exclusion protein, partial [Lactobacillus crispatus]|uniref:MbeD/MobD family mobilization/exclusion protein n=1 Tax=Lactobacillus crispatus TaxID=47770 RepID=UPI003F201F98
MTELEGHLLNALEHLQQDYMRRLNEWEILTAQCIRRRDDVFVVTARTARDNPLLHFQATIFHFIQQREFGFTVRHAFGLNFNLTQNVGQVLV